MAAKRKCEVCDVEFSFSSKYQRHLESISHKRFCESLNSSLREQADISGTQFLDEGNDRSTEGGIGSEKDNLLWDDDTLESSDDEDKNEFSIEQCEEENELDDKQCEEEYVRLICEQQCSEGTPQHMNYHPFCSKLQALLFILVNGPRQMGEENLKFVFHILQQSQSAVPSLSSIKKITVPGFQAPCKHYTSDGIPFYINLPSNIVKRCIGVLDIAKSIARFPVLSSNGVREMFQANRWHSDDRFSAPMINHSQLGHVFVGDFVQCDCNSSVCTAKVKCFFKKDTTDCVFVQIIPLHLFEGKIAVSRKDVSVIMDSQLMSIVAPPSRIFQKTEESGYIEMSQEEYGDFISPHHLKEIAGGMQVIMVPLVLFSDDTSGNRSKQWNKFDYWSLKLAGLPIKENNKLQNIHFICCSNLCGALNMTTPLTEDLLKLELSGIQAYDALLEQEVLVVAPVICVTGDNPRQSEISSHAGTTAKRYCRKCKVERGQQATQIAELRTKEQTQSQIAEISFKKTEKEKAQLKTQYGLSLAPNPLLRIPMNLHQCTPVETLHTILLGPYKYFIRQLIPRLTGKERNEIQAIVSSFNFSGFPEKLNPRFIKHYKSMIGRNFKALAQCAIFIFRHILTANEKRMWLSLSKVFQISYCEAGLCTEKSQLDAICREFVNTASSISPSLLNKAKIHLLLHLPDDIVEFGPTAAFNTERCEAFNSLLRSRNVYSNRFGPSRDIARGFEVIQNLRAVCGSFQTSDGSRVGSDLTELYNSPAVQMYLNGMTAKQIYGKKGIYQFGALRKLKKQSTVGVIKVTLNDLGDISLEEASKMPELTLLCPVSLEQQVKEYGGIIGNDGALIHTGDYLKYTDHIDSIGLLLTSFSCNDQPYSVVRPLEKLDTFGEPLLNEFDCPLLSMSDILYCIPSQTILHSCSVVHECSNTCKFVSDTVHTQLEHEDISRTQLCYHHDWSNNMYCLNVYCMNT